MARNRSHGSWWSVKDSKRALNECRPTVLPTDRPVWCEEKSSISQFLVSVALHLCFCMLQQNAQTSYVLIIGLCILLRVYHILAVTFYFDLCVLTRHRNIHHAITDLFVFRHGFTKTLMFYVVRRIHKLVMFIALF
jgi:hypothetical protein